MKSTIKVQTLKKAQIDQYSLLVATVEDGYARFDGLFGDKPEFLPLHHLLSMPAADASEEYENAVLRASGYAQSMIGQICKILSLKVDVLLGPPENFKDWGVESKGAWTPIYVIEDVAGSRTIYPASSSYLMTKRYLLLKLFGLLALHIGGKIDASITPLH